MKILDDNEFWNLSSLKDIDNFGKEYSTGYFANILNKNTTEKEFSIGLCCNLENAKYFDAINIVFSNSNKLPVISQLKYFKDNRTIHVIIHNDEIEYCVSKSTLKISNDTDSFKIWINKESISDTKLIRTEKRINSIAKIINLINREVLHNSTIIQIENIFQNLINEPPIRNELKGNYGNELGNLEIILKQKDKTETLTTFGANACMFDNVSVNTISENEYSIEIKYKKLSYQLITLGSAFHKYYPHLQIFFFLKTPILQYNNRKFIYTLKHNLNLVSSYSILQIIKTINL